MRSPQSWMAFLLPLDFPFLKQFKETSFLLN